MDNHLDDVRNWQILVVEDSLELADIVRHLLTRQGATVHLAATGEDAFRLLVDFEPTLILLDLTLPDTDGFTVLDTVRNQFNVHSPVVAFTARSHGEALNLIDRGFDNYILKPFRMDGFVDSLARILQETK